MLSPTLSWLNRVTSGPTVKVSSSPFSVRRVIDRVAGSIAVMVAVAVTEFSFVTVLAAWLWAKTAIGNESSAANAIDFSMFCAPLVNWTSQKASFKPLAGSRIGRRFVLAPIFVDRRPGHARGRLIFRTSSALADEMPDRHAGSSIVPRCARQRIGEARCTEEQRREAGCPAGNCVANHWDETLARPWRDDDPCQKGCSMKGVKLLEPLRERQPAMVVLPTPGRPLRTIRMRSR